MLLTYMLKIDHTKTTTIYLGKKDEVINTLLQPHIKNINNRNYKIKINDFLKLIGRANRL